MTRGLVTLYTFEELNGMKVGDISGRGKPVDAEFIGPNVSYLKWLTGALNFFFPIFLKTQCYSSQT